MQKKEIIEEFREKLKKTRMRKTELAALLGVSTTVINRFFRLDANPQLENLIILAEAMGYELKVSLIKRKDNA